MAIRVVAVAIWAAAALAGHADPAESPARRELRLALRRVVRASREQFKPLQGARIDIRPGRESWFEAREDLPGATSCRVYEHPLAYTCRWEKAPGRTDIPAVFKTFTADVEAVLGEEWERGETRGEVRFREKEEGTAVAMAIEQGAVRLTVTPGVRRKPEAAQKPLLDRSVAGWQPGCQPATQICNGYFRDKS